VRRQIAVVGSWQSAEETDAIAFEVGAELARRGAVLICGGLSGAMEQTTSLITQSRPGWAKARNAVVVKSGKVGGPFGTLSEIALALKLRKPVVGIATWQFSIPGVDTEFPRAETAEDAIGILFEAWIHPIKVTS
jgi:predicted Rossmann-fold nucleotide-binding protein